MNDPRPRFIGLRLWAVIGTLWPISDEDASGGRAVEGSETKQVLRAWEDWGLGTGYGDGHGEGEGGTGDGTGCRFHMTLTSAF